MGERLRAFVVRLDSEILCVQLGTLDRDDDVLVVGVLDRHVLTVDGDVQTLGVRFVVVLLVVLLVVGLDRYLDALLDVRLGLLNDDGRIGGPRLGGVVCRFRGGLEDDGLNLRDFDGLRLRDCAPRCAGRGGLDLFDRRLLGSRDRSL